MEHDAVAYSWGEGRGVDGHVASGMHYLKLVQLTFQTGKRWLAICVVEIG